MALKAVLIAPDGQRLERYRQLIVSAEKGVEVVAMADSLAKGKEEIYRSIPDMVLINHEQALDFIENVHLALHWMVISAERSFDAAGGKAAIGKGRSRAIHVVRQVMERNTVEI